MKKLKIALCADHAGYELKQVIKSFLASTERFDQKDFGTFSTESCDYPDFAHLMATAIERKEFDFGISCCGTGNGINMAANRHKGVRSALCWTPEIAQLAREHNDANVLALPARFITEEQALEIVKVFLSSKFEGGRHQKRIEKIEL